MGALPGEAMKTHVLLLPSLLATGLLTGVPATAQTGPWSTTVYLQQSWPKQTETNRQIKEINATFGTSFKTWDDVANLNLGLQVFRDLDPRWKIGVEFDYSKGKISDSATIATLAGPANLAFEQKYTLYVDFLAVAQFRPLGAKGRWVPFLQAGLGYAYEKDETHLTLRNPLIDDALHVENSGWFPMLTAGVGLDVFLNIRRTCYAEAGISYSWARLKHGVPASGSLAPAPTVTADTDSTGPNLWLGIGWRF